MEQEGSLQSIARPGNVRRVRVGIVVVEKLQVSNILSAILYSSMRSVWMQNIFPPYLINGTISRGRGGGLK